MANIDQKLNVSELDFNDIKTNLKNFLRDQSEFEDFDFEAAGINVLLDILAYNTHYMAYYNNMIANEMFLDTAVMRDSVVSHAKMLGYTPRSSVAARATIDLQISRTGGSTQTSLTLPKFTRFQSSPLDSISYTFVNLEDKIGEYDPACGRFCFKDLYIYQGTPLSYTFTYDSTSNLKQTFILPDAGIDTSTLSVIVQESSTSLRSDNYVLASDATVVSADSKVFYLDEIRNGSYQIYFGDGVIGKSLSHGNIVIVTYISTDGAAANKSNTFSLAQSVGGFSTHVIYPIVAANGGDSQESTESVRFSAPKAYAANDRGVTKDDLISIINKNYPYFQSINVWGGEENNPPVYGKVYIAAKPTSGYEITESEKLDVINNVIKPICVVTVKPEFVDVDYNYLNVFAEVYYDKTKTPNSGDAIASIVRNAILSYGASDLNDFNSKFKMSKLLRYIDDSEASILYSDAVVTITKRLDPIIGSPKNYKINFGTPISRDDPHYKIFSAPAFNQYDDEGSLRQCFFEEIPGKSSGIDSIDVAYAPNKYEEQPEIVISGDGIGAMATADIVNGKLVGVKILNTGINYTTATATLIYRGAVDTNVTLNVYISTQYGALQTYYFDDNNNKLILNPEAGQIDYLNGTITLIQFDPVSIDNPLKIMRFTAKSVANNFESSRQRILTIDPDDQSGLSSIVVNMKTST